MKKIMKKQTKSLRIISLLLAAVMLFCVMPSGVFATDEMATTQIVSYFCSNEDIRTDFELVNSNGTVLFTDDTLPKQTNVGPQYEGAGVKPVEGVDMGTYPYVFPQAYNRIKFTVNIPKDGLYSVTIGSTYCAAETYLLEGDNNYLIDGKVISNGEIINAEGKYLSAGEHTLQLWCAGSNRYHSVTLTYVGEAPTEEPTEEPVDTIVSYFCSNEDIRTDFELVNSSGTVLFTDDTLPKQTNVGPQYEGGGTASPVEGVDMGTYPYVYPQAYNRIEFTVNIPKDGFYSVAIGSTYHDSATYLLDGTSNYLLDGVMIPSGTQNILNEATYLTEGEHTLKLWNNGSNRFHSVTFTYVLKTTIYNFAQNDHPLDLTVTTRDGVEYSADSFNSDGTVPTWGTEQLYPGALSKVEFTATIPDDGWYRIKLSGLNTNGKYHIFINGMEVSSGQFNIATLESFENETVVDEILLLKGTHQVGVLFEGAERIKNMSFVNLGKNVTVYRFIKDAKGLDVDFSLSSGDTYGWGGIRGDGSYSLYMGPGGSAEFNVDFPCGGAYKVNAGILNVGSATTKGSPLQVDIDGVTVGIESFVGFGNLTSAEIADDVSLDAGSHKITLRTYGSERVYYLAFTAVKKDPYKIKSFSFENKDGETLQTLKSGSVIADCVITKQLENDYVPKIVAASYKNGKMTSVNMAEFITKEGNSVEELGINEDAFASVEILVEDNADFVKAFIWFFDNDSLTPVAQSMKLNKYADVLKLEADDYIDSSDVSIVESGKDRVVILNDGDYVTYSFDVPTTDIYTLELVTETDGTIWAYFDDSLGGVETEVLGFSYDEIGAFELSQGEHTVKIAAKDKIVLKSLSLKYAYGDAINLGEIGSEEILNIDKAEEAHPVYLEYYVSPDGQDTNPGTELKPFKTIEKAKEKAINSSYNMTGDIIINIKPGRYVIDKTIAFGTDDGGKNGYDIIFRGTDKDNPPIIDGGIEITDWTKVTDEIYSAAADVEDMRNLYINGFAAQRARSKYLYSATGYYDDPETTQETDGYYVSKRNFPDNLTKTKGMESVQVNKWTSNRSVVKDIISGTGDYSNFWIIRFEQPWYEYMTTMRSIHNTSPHMMNTFYIENAPELLDEPGEFYFDKDNKTVYYYPFAEENLETAETYAGNVDTLLSISGTYLTDRIENLSFDNMKFCHGAWHNVSETGVASFQADHLYNIKPYTSELSGGRTTHAQINVKNANNINFTNCRFENLGSAAISMDEDVHNCDVTGNVFKDISGTAVIVGNGRYSDGSVYKEDGDVCSRINISNNAIRRVGLEFHFCPAIGVYYANSINISNNDIAQTPYTGITLGWGWGNSNSQNLKCANHKITGNRIDETSKVCRDGGGIYTLGQMNDTVVSYNYLSDSPDFGGIYHDSGSKNISTHHNVIENGRWAIFAGNLMTDVYDNYANFEDEEEKDFGIIVESEGFGDEAQAIIDSAGLENEYESLALNLEYPLWRTDFMQKSRMSPFESDATVIIESTDYMPGGEGIGYHDYSPSGPRNYSYLQDGSVIADNSAGEWLSYIVNIPYTGEWDVDMVYGIPVNEEKNGITLYVDGTEVISNAYLPATGSYEVFAKESVGKISLKEGKHIIKLEFRMPMSYDQLELTLGNSQNDEKFDDAKLFTIN